MQAGTHFLKLRSEDFGFKFSGRAVVFVNFTRWIGFGMSVPFRRIDFGGFMS